MNAHTAKALVQDAFYQVLDNKVFRLLVILAFCMIAPTFLIAFKPDEISVLFGLWKVSYPALVHSWGVGSASSPHANEIVIQTVQKIFIEGLAGTFGILLSLAATAFFVPRMLEKGEADTLFSKPVSRFVLLMARYFAGVMFVGLLGLVLVFGMHVGFLLRSGYSDPGFLWGALTLTYVFALIHAFSTAVGVFTRSSVAALLLSILLFFGNGCVQSGWVLREHHVEADRIHQQTREDDSPAVAEDEGTFIRLLFAAVDVLHFVLPKTHDADVLTQKLRQAVGGTGPVVVDTGGKLAVQSVPSGLVRSGSGKEIDLGSTPATWTVEENGREVARIALTRNSRLVEKSVDGKVRTSRRSSSTAASELVTKLGTAPDTDGKPMRGRFGRGAGNRVTWREKRDPGTVARERVFLPLEDWMYEVDLTADPTWLTQEDHGQLLEDFLGGVKPLGDSAVDLDSNEWYARHFGWTAPLKYNAFFSLGSSIAFAVLLLLCAGWRLSRIDF